jgi:hypothetical protein
VHNSYFGIVKFNLQFEIIPKCFFLSYKRSSRTLLLRRYSYAQCTRRAV